MPALGLATHAVKPAGDGGVGVTSEADHDRQIDAFSQKPQYPLNTLQTGFEIVERRANARSEHLAARLTLESLDAVMITVANQRMNGIVGDAAVGAVGIWAGEAACGNQLLASARAFGL